MNKRAALKFVAVVAVVGLSGCSEDATSLQVVVNFGSLQLDQIAIKGTIAGKLRFGGSSGRRFPAKPGTVRSGDDVVVIFPDEDAGKSVLVTVQGFRKAQAVALASGRATLVAQEVVRLTIQLGPSKPPDGGLDASDGAPPDGRQDGKPPPPDGHKDVTPPPDLPLLPDGGCTVGTSFCKGDAIVTCVGTEAGPTQVANPCPLGCVFSAPVKCRELVPSTSVPSSFINTGQDSFIPKASLVSINTDSGKITGHSVLAVTMTSSQPSPARPITVMAFREITIPKGVTVEVSGTRPLALVASGPITIEGKIIATGGVGDAGPGGYTGASQYQSAKGTGAGSNGQHKLYKLPPYYSIYVTSGGGGGAHGAVGGLGGKGEFSSIKVSGGSGGKTSTSLSLVPLVGGSGGGRGGTNNTSVGNHGGGGGGALQLISGSSIKIGSPGGAGGVNLGGGGGGAAGKEYGAGGGGGSGGGLLMEAPTVTLHGGATLAANGGGGAGGTGSKKGGQNGSIGALSNKLTNYGTPSTNGGNGGYGGAGNTPAGIDGSPKIAGGGGGGGAGIVRINTKTGSAKIDGTISAVLSQGKLKTSPP